MAAIVMFPGASLYVKSQLSLWPSIRKESKYLLPSQPLSQHFSSSLLIRQPIRYSQTVSCYPDQSSSPRTRLNLNPSTKLFVSGLSFRTTEESLRNAFNNFGELVEVNLMMDKIANRPRGFAFLILAMLRRRNHIKQLRECMARWTRTIDSNKSRHKQSKIEAQYSGFRFITSTSSSNYGNMVVAKNFYLKATDLDLLSFTPWTCIHCTGERFGATRSVYSSDFQLYY
ncbi:serine/arginine-rich splicing factor SR45a-like [Lycium barbarum]|uniref:serine/arginine-rich splicing factor SR45a-like n=1 Tax=Lycium barbarum TaxID=112863 RepID=UPI00293E4E70|nr:serine/arginine-rich splicing factor SR45a-like [Lycium barbarum]